MRKLSVFIGIIALMMFIGCGEESEIMTGSTATQSKAESQTVIEQTRKTAPELYYFGHASMCIVTEDDKVIYIDPYANGDYSRAADLILVTHGHFDHNQIDKVENRNDNCEIITQNEALRDGKHQTFEYPFVKAEAVEAGNNPNHSINECVGYLLTFNNGKTLYISGDTSTTDRMSELSERNIDYAFFCCDGVYNMDITEAASCAETVGAKHNIPYHNSTSHTGEMFDRELADEFDAPNKMIVYPGSSFAIE